MSGKWVEPNGMVRYAVLTDTAVPLDDGFVCFVSLWKIQAQAAITKQQACESQAITEGLKPDYAITGSRWRGGGARPLLLARMAGVHQPECQDPR